MPYSAIGQAKVPESQVVEIWRRLLWDVPELMDEDGEPIEIIYPGRANDGRGADFRDAVIATSQGLIRGDIEVHVKSSDWQAHRHYSDPVYNRVILHVVMGNDSKTSSSLPDGRTIPTLALQNYVKSPVSQWNRGIYPGAIQSMPCLKATERLARGVIAEFLDDTGEERFLDKANRFQIELGQVEAGQCLYQGIMGALGYSKNKMPFLKLASRLPLYFLESIVQEKMSDEGCLAGLQALLLGTAGLLPSQRPNWCLRKELDDEWVDTLERLWAFSCRTETMSASDWQLFRVRPSNFPIRRIVAISYLIFRYREKGILGEVVDMVRGVVISKSNCQLEKMLRVSAEGFWASHFDFGANSRIGNPTLLGSGRAADIIVNVLLPFTAAWSRVTGHLGLERKAIDIYHSYPRLGVNSVERHMRHQLGLSSRLVNSARRQQGLIHIYKTLCTQGKCSRCWFGKDN